jgi:hypothetical protein
MIPRCGIGGRWPSGCSEGHGGLNELALFQGTGLLSLLEPDLASFSGFDQPV